MLLFKAFKRSVSGFGIFPRLLAVAVVGMLAASMMSAGSSFGASSSGASPVGSRASIPCRHLAAGTGVDSLEEYRNVVVDSPGNESAGSQGSDPAVMRARCGDKVIGPFPVTADLMDLVADVHVGDVVNLRMNPKKELVAVDVFVPVADRLRCFVLSALITGGLSLVIMWGCKGRVLAVLKLIEGKDGRFSNSKTQAAVWFFVLIVSYLSITLLRIQVAGLALVGGVSIPENLLYLSGFSALTYAGAKAITQGQVNANPTSKEPARAGSAGLADYVTDDAGHADFGDFQMTMVTLFAIAIYVLQAFDFSGRIALTRVIVLPDVDSTLLSLFGISQGAYLFKKAAVATAARSAQP